MLAAPSDVTWNRSIHLRHMMDAIDAQCEQNVYMLSHVERKESAHQSHHSGALNGRIETILHGKNFPINLAL
jgi:hypothetical protein